MKNVILGTAGHVDHGKTALIRALTGIDTDRLAEEKKRGITIELGFAHLSFDDGLQVGIVDVPGHEKFIKNMLAGAGGIDLGMLVIAANEGVMPQTVEHLNILRLLGVKDGLVVITKKDMVDEEWLELVEDDARALVEGTFLAGKPVLACSAYTGEGIAELKEALHTLILAADEKNLKAPFRLPIDRVFAVEGFGTVVTGTLIEGGVSVGDPVTLLPSGIECRVRTLQVHNRNVQIAGAGQRVAMNLSGVHKDEIERGEVAVRPGSVRTSMMLDVRLELLSKIEHTVKSGSVVHLYHGARTMLAKAVLLDRDELRAGEHCYAQLRLTEEIAAKNGDRFVIRFYSPLETIGGGVILDESPRKHKRFAKTVLSALEVRESGSGEKKLIQTVAEEELSLPDCARIAKLTHRSAETLEPELTDLVRRGLLVEALPGRYAAPEVLDANWPKCEHALEEYHKTNPLHAGMPLPVLRQKAFRGGAQTECDAILHAYAAEEHIRISGDYACLFDFRVVLTKKQRAIRERLLDLYQKAGIDSPNWDDVLVLFAPNERADAKMVLESLVTGRELIMLTPQIIWHADTYTRVWQTVLDYFAEHETITSAEVRDLLGSSRKYTIALLEYADRCKLTRFDGESRRLIRKD